MIVDPEPSANVPASLWLELEVDAARGDYWFKRPFIEVSSDGTTRKIALDDSFNTHRRMSKRVGIGEWSIAWIDVTERFNEIEMNEGDRFREKETPSIDE